MRAYAEAYLSDVVENQGKLFDFVAQSFPDKNTEDFTNESEMSTVKVFIDKENFNLVFLNHFSSLCLLAFH